MSKIKSFKELIVWQKSILLVKLIYQLTYYFPTEEKFGLTSQIRRCAVSIPSNIAEGWGRNSSNHFQYFLSVSQGSLSELETQLIIAKELGFVQFYKEIEDLILEIGKMLSTMRHQTNS
nr:four helix bundle protein [uncultured Capnocytophaga sp.]